MFIITILHVRRTQYIIHLIICVNYEIPCPRDHVLKLIYFSTLTIII